MTEVLARRMREASGDIVVPPAPAAAVITQGRQTRRRRQVTAMASTLLGVAATVAVIVGAVSLIGFRPAADRMAREVRVSDGPTFARTSYLEDGAVAFDETVYVGGKEIDFGDRVNSLYYTGGGLLVRTARSPWTATRDVQHYTLMSPAGERREIDLPTRNRLVGTEPDSTRLAYLTPAGSPGSSARTSQWNVAVVDVTTGGQVSWPVEGRYTWGDLAAPPVELDGDLVWVHFDGGWTEVDWRTGQTRQVPGGESVRAVANGRYVQEGGQVWTVRSMVDGEAVGSIDVSPSDAWADFSPDGVRLRFRDMTWPVDEDGNFDRDYRMFDTFVFSAESEGTVTPPFPLVTRGIGWTPAGDTLLVNGAGEAHVCGSDTGECRPTGVRVDLVGRRLAKIGGVDYD